MKFIVACFALALAVQVNAAEIKLATIATDTMEDKTIFYLETNPTGEAQALRYVTTVNSGQITEDVHATMAEVLDDGFILEEMEGREIIRLFMEGFQPTAGGKVKLYYLVNGATGGHNSMYMKLVKTADGFVLHDMDGKLINTIFVKGNWSRLLRRWIGVSQIQTSFDVKNK